MDISPDYESFSARYEAGDAQIVWRKAPADLHTPVSLLLKLSEAGENRFLLESVIDASADGHSSVVKGRYSVIGLEPDLIWRCRGVSADKGSATPFAEIWRRSDQASNNAGAFERFGSDGAEGVLTGLRQLLDESRLDMPEAVPPMCAGLFGYLGYDMVRLVERLPEPNEDVLKLPDAILMRPSLVIVVDHAFDDMFVTTTVRPSDNISARAAHDTAIRRITAALDRMESGLPDGAVADRLAQDSVVERRSNTTSERYRQNVETAKEYIAAGDIFQVVPSQRWRFPFAAPPVALYRALRRTNPSRYMFFFDFAENTGNGGFQIVGASPEILVQVAKKPGSDDRVVKLRPIAGTRRRGATKEEDEALIADLLGDPKERAEHLMLLDLGRNDVGRVAKIGSVRVDPAKREIVERYSHVMHIVSEVEGVLRDEHDALSALLAGLPAGTVSGAPKIRAMEIIDELETEKRGVYAGGVGYFAANGDMDTCIALRTAVVKDGLVFVQAGGGVVADSDPEAELQETINKSQAVIRAAETAKRFGGGDAD